MALDDALHRVVLYTILEEGKAVLAEKYKEIANPSGQQPSRKFAKKEGYGKTQHAFAIDTKKIKNFEYDESKFCIPPRSVAIC